MNTIRKGDRGTVGFEMLETDNSNLPYYIRLGDDPTQTYWVEEAALARATILPRKLEVGMRVNSPNEGPGKILAIDDGLAWVKFDHDRGTNTFPISRLTPIDSDEPSDDGKGAE